MNDILLFICILLDQENLRRSFWSVLLNSPASSFFVSVFFLLHFSLVNHTLKLSSPNFLCFRKCLVNQFYCGYEFNFNFFCTFIVPKFDCFTVDCLICWSLRDVTFKLFISCCMWVGGPVVWNHLLLFILFIN